MNQVLDLHNKLPLQKSKLYKWWVHSTNPRNASTLAFTRTNKTINLKTKSLYFDELDAANDQQNKK